MFPKITWKLNLVLLNNKNSFKGLGKPWHSFMDRGRAVFGLSLQDNNNSQLTQFCHASFWALQFWKTSNENRFSLEFSTEEREKCFVKWVSHEVSPWKKVPVDFPTRQLASQSLEKSETGFLSAVYLKWSKPFISSFF